MYVPILIVRLLGISLALLFLAVLIILINMIPKRIKRKSVLIGNSQKKGDRKIQEDSFSTFETDNGVIAILADGMGGLERGKIASDTTVKMFIEEFTKEYELYDVQKFLINSAYTANDKIVNIANGRKIGTTLIAAIIRDKKLYWISVGDSRIYLFRKGELIKLNEEHTYERELNKLYEHGKISRNEIKEHPQREFLTSYIGYEEFYELDYSKAPIQLSSGDKIILMSDGIYKSISEYEIKEILKKRHKPDKKCELITEKVEKKNITNQDNMTVVLVENK